MPYSRAGCWVGATSSRVGCFELKASTSRGNAPDAASFDPAPPRPSPPLPAPPCAVFASPSPHPYALCFIARGRRVSDARSPASRSPAPLAHPCHSCLLPRPPPASPLTHPPPASPAHPWRAALIVTQVSFPPCWPRVVKAFLIATRVGSLLCAIPPHVGRLDSFPRRHARKRAVFVATTYATVTQRV